MFGDVYNNRSRSLPDSPAGGEPSPLLTRLLIPGEQDAEDGSGFAARTTTRDGHGEPPPAVPITAAEGACGGASAGRSERARARVPEAGELATTGGTSAKRDGGQFPP